MPADSNADSAAFCHARRPSNRRINNALNSARSPLTCGVVECKAAISSLSSRQRNPFESSDTCQRRHQLKIWNCRKDSKTKWSLPAESKTRAPVKTVREQSMFICSNCNMQRQENSLGKFQCKINVKIFRRNGKRECQKLLTKLSSICFLSFSNSSDFCRCSSASCFNF